MSEHTPDTILTINASARYDGSISRTLVADLTQRLAGPQTQLIARDLTANPPSFIDPQWVTANFTDPSARTAANRAALAESDALVGELQKANTIVIGAPIYNFSIPAALKAWIDQVARARVTFRYTPDGPEGLLKGKKAYVVLTSGGAAAGTEIDFASGYLRHILGFLGITDVEFITADQLMMHADEKISRAKAQLAQLAA